MTSPAPDYTLTVKDMAGSTVVADLPSSSLMLSRVLDSPGAAEFSLPMRHVSAVYADLRPLTRRVQISRGGSLKWGGDLWTVTLDTASQMVRFLCNGYFERLRHRFFAQNLYYAGVEQFDIAWGVISYTQGLSGLGITRDGGETPSGKTRNRHFCAWESGSVADAIEELSIADDGFDFDITPDLIWKVWYPYRGATSPVKSFILGDSPDDTTNIWDLRYSDDGSDAANQIAGIPDDECLDLADFVVVNSSASQSIYGLMQDAISLPHISHRADRRSYLNEELRARRYSKRQLVITTPDMPWDATAYEVGDNVSVTADLGYVNYSAQSFRVMSWEVRVEQGQELAQVVLDSETI